MKNTSVKIRVAKSSPATPSTNNLDPIVQLCFKRIRHWQVPPRWSLAQWLEEALQVTWVAAFEAALAYDPSKGAPPGQFVYDRACSRAYSCYRKEWTYAKGLALGPLEDDSVQDDVSAGPASNGQPATEGADTSPLYAELLDAFESLPPPLRRLIEEHFWNGRTQCELARVRRITQQEVSKLERAALDDLRKRLLPAYLAARQGRNQKRN
jgi:RNA polymerase sigma factor (sigma-70 family)